MPEAPLSTQNLSRRRLLQLSLGLPVLAASLWLPVRALAQALPPKNAPPIADASQMPGRKPRAPRLLMIDPGHGGHDPGAIGRNRTQEKDITLDIARRMADILSGRPDLDAKLTRDEDIFLPLPERVRISRAAHADMFISIHADSAPSKFARGLSAYTLSEKASDSFAKALATQENRVEAMGGVDLGQTDRDVAEILMDLTARRTRNTSQRARFDFIHAVGRNWHLLERPMRSADFAVLRAPDVPSMLIETGFLSSPQDEALLRQPQQRQKIAQLMAKELSGILTGPLFS